MHEDGLLSDRAVVDAILRRELYMFVQQVFRTLNGNGFIPGWYLEVVTDWLMLAASGDINRLIITMPPRHLKSICASVALPAWILGRDPSARITCVSYGDDLAKKHARDCLKIMESAWYIRAFPNTRISKKRFAISDFETTKGGGRLATSVSGALTGRGGRYIIVDDPIKPEDARSKAIRTRTNEWFDHTVYSRFDDPEKGVMIIVMQRVHLDDLVGHVLEKEHWELLSFPAIAEEDEDYTLMRDVDVGRKSGEALHPERMSLKKLTQTKRDIGSFAFQSQYQQQPVPEAGNIVKRMWFQTYDHVPPPAKYSDQIIQSWDTAVSLNDTADWSVCRHGPSAATNII